MQLVTSVSNLHLKVAQIFGDFLVFLKTSNFMYKLLWAPG